MLKSVQRGCIKSKVYVWILCMNLAILSIGIILNVGAIESSSNDSESTATMILGMIFSMGSLLFSVFMSTFPGRYFVGFTENPEGEFRYHAFKTYASSFMYLLSIIYLILSICFLETNYWFTYQAACLLTMNFASLTLNWIICLLTRPVIGSSSHKMFYEYEKLVGNVHVSGSFNILLLFMMSHILLNIGFGVISIDGPPHYLWVSVSFIGLLVATTFQTMVVLDYIKQTRELDLRHIVKLYLPYLGTSIIASCVLFGFYYDDRNILFPQTSLERSIFVCVQFGCSMMLAIVILIFIARRLWMKYRRRGFVSLPDARSDSDSNDVPI